MKKCASLALAALFSAFLMPSAQAADQIPHGPKPDVNPKIVQINENIFAQKPYKIAYANWNDQNSFSILVRDSMQAACDYYGVELMTLDNRQDPAQASTNVDNAIQAEVNYYLQYNQDNSVNAKLAEKLEGLGIPTIAIQTKARDGVDPEYVVDNTETGAIGGKLLTSVAKERWPNEQPVLFVAGHPESGQNFIDRANGCIAAAKAAMPDVKIVEISTDGNPEVTRQKTADFLTANPAGKIMMWCHIDQNTMGMLGAVKAAGRQEDVIIASVGGNQVVFEELKRENSPIIGTVAHFPERWGWDMLPLILDHLDNGKKPPMKFIPPLDILTRDNLGEYYPGA